MRARYAFMLIAFAGCDFGMPEAPTITNSCTDDASCPAGVCDGNLCIDDSAASLSVTLEVLRAPSAMQETTPASWVFGFDSVSGPSTRDLVLPPTRPVRGSVRLDGLRVPATLRFVPRAEGAAAALTPVAVEVDTLREPADQAGAASYDFSTVLVVGEIYDVVVSPSSDAVMAFAQEPAPAIRSLPPLYLELTIGDGDPGEPFRFDIVFPTDLGEPCTLTKVRCTLEAEVLSVAGTEEQAEAGLQVRAIDRVSGLVVSSIGETDENGHFMIRIGETAPDYLIRVTSTVGGDPFPAVSVDPSVAFISVKRIYIPRLSPVQLNGRVQDTNDRPVPGATVRFLSTGIFDGSQLGLVGSFSASTTTDEEGNFGTELLPGYYSIAVTPPDDALNTWGILSDEALVGEAITTIEPLIVPSQLQLSGSVTTFGDEPAAGITIVAGSRTSGDAGAMHRSQETISNELGAFSMSIDSGLFDVQVKVPSETGFAWMVEPELVMSQERGNLERAYRLEPPIPVRGVVRTSDGEIVPAALIRAYVMTGNADAGSRPVQVAETVAQADGSYRLLIAPRFAGP